MFRAGTDAVVLQFEICQGTSRETSGEFPGRLVEICVSKLSPVASDHFVRSHLGNISRKEHLQGAFTLLTSPTSNQIPKTRIDETAKNLGVTRLRDAHAN